MFLVDKYKNLYQNYYSQNVKHIMKDFKSNTKNEFEYANFQHLIVYGQKGCGKEAYVNTILKEIYGEKAIKLKDLEYTIKGYSNTLTKVEIKGSNYHIIIKPNMNGFDRYLIQEIIQNYAEKKVLNILKKSKLFKIVLINKIDNLSYYAQASLRRTMEKYSDTCKFIFICDQLSKIIEPLRSRCCLVRCELLKPIQIKTILDKVVEEEEIDITEKKINNILNNCDNIVNKALWMLEFDKHNLKYKNEYETIIDEIVNMLFDKKNYTNTKTLSMIEKCRELYYKLFITNINMNFFLKIIMNKILNNIDDIKIKLNVIEITTLVESRFITGSRNIVHFDNYIIRLLLLLNGRYKESYNKLEL